MYHRVAQKGIDPWSLAVTPEHFDQQLAVLKKHAQPLSLLELHQAHKKGKVPEGAVAITFDDGYANNLLEATPILQSHGIPATIFVATGYIEKQREYWWDELDQIFFRPVPLPSVLKFSYKGQHFKYHLGKATEYTEQEVLEDYDTRVWNARPQNEDGSLQSSLGSITTFSRRRSASSA